LRHTSFRKLYIAWVCACLCMFMSDVASAWLMTSLTTSPILVALVQSAATLPIFLFGLPSGALADILDRRRLLIFTQVWGVAVAAMLFSTAITASLNPAFLLVLVFANGIVLAIRWPAFSATIPELVPLREVPLASALSGVANNGSRIVGPLLAGVIIATYGPAWAFALTATLSAIAATLLFAWPYRRKPSALPSERISGAMRVGVQHVRQSPRVRMVMARVVCFFFNSIAVMALLPLVAKELVQAPSGHGGAQTFSLLLAMMGAGAVTVAMAMPAINRRFTRDVRYRTGTIVFAAATVVVALSPWRGLAFIALYFAGAAWLFTANTLMVAGTLSLPDWVRARGLSIIQMSMMGATASGAAIWGWVASHGSVRIALLASALGGPLGLLITRRTVLGKDAPEELTPAGNWTHPELATPIDPDEGPVLVMVEYQIDPAKTDEFVALMRESRRVWLAHGLLEWQLFSDVSREGRHVEHMVDESWAAYLRRNERIAASYLPLRERKRAMHIGPDAPVVSRYIARH
jgi:MFS family permease